MSAITSELVGYVLKEMLTADQMKDFCNGHNIAIPRGERTDQCRVLGSTVSFADLHDYCLAGWDRPIAEIHLSNLTSGLLDGFSWHNLAPAYLHLGLQNYVRRVAKGELLLPEFLSLGSNIVKKEYVMVAIADLTELILIDRCGGTPPLKAKALSDLVFRGLPYDVKNTSPSNDWGADRIRRDPAGFSRAMVLGANSERTRKQADKAFNVWALNRFFVVTEEEGLWLTRPAEMMDRLATVALSLRDPFELEVDGLRILSQVVVL